MSTFVYKQNQFYFNDTPIRLVSGAIHYFRVVPQYWEDRLLKLKACGFNTVETYIPWNLHESKEGHFKFSGMADVEAFVKIAGALDLHVIVRPSPYICAEWEFGGLPAWLLADKSIQLRTINESYQQKIEAYYDELLPRLKPLFCTHGGPIIAIQIENEYGSYGNDTLYLQFIQEALLKRGVDILMFTSDGPEHHMLQGGMVPGVLETVNFGSKAKEGFDILKQYQPEAPLMCMEFWNGWFDHWGEEHHVRDGQDVSDVFKEMLELGASVNFYMFHGGTNFGFYNGANAPLRHQYEPTITSYDYNAPLNEAGDPTEKYYAIRDILKPFIDKPELEVPPALPKRAYGKLKVNEIAPLLNQLNELTLPIEDVWPQAMEMYGQSYGFILYETHITGPRDEQPFVLQDCHDRALIYFEDQFLGVVERWNPDKQIKFAVPENGGKLRILVENMGRINYGPFLRDAKGITEGVRHGNQFLYHWTIWPLPMEELKNLKYSTTAEAITKPAFYRTILNITDKPQDTFLKLSGWTKGVVWINQFNLGRYWKIGPQQTLYIPAPLLKEGENEIIIFELEGTSQLEIEFIDTPILG